MENTSLISEMRSELPFVLEAKEVVAMLKSSEKTVYRKLNAGEIPGGKNIPGIGWRINRDIFLTWLYTTEGGEMDETRTTCK